MQLSSSLTVTMPLADFPGGDAAGVLVTRPSGTEDAFLLPATYSEQDHAVSAQVWHLSEGWG